MKRLFVRITAAALTLVMLFSGSLTFISAGDPVTYPELIITEMCCDTYGDAANAKNTNTKYNGTAANRDVFEFIEIYNNCEKAVNIYDYMLAYQATGSDDADFFESSVQEYTPFFPGRDWTDSTKNTSAKYWKNTTDKMPENPAYEKGEIAPGEVFVVWMYSDSSQYLHATTEQFRKFWSIPDSVKVFLLDADSSDEMNFDLKNTKTGTYMIMVQSDRFPRRRSADKTFYPESDNKHHNYFGKTYQDLDEIISWAVIDYKTEPLKSFSAANGNENSASNFTVSYLPETGNDRAENGFTAKSFKSGKRAHIEKIGVYADATVGKLDDAQTAAFKNTKTPEKKAVKNTDIYSDPVNNNERPDLLITEISPDQFGTKGNGCAKYQNQTADVFEFIEVYNNSGRELNIFDYMVGYQGSASTSVSTYFEKLVQEYTAIVPGADWTDAPYTFHDSYWGIATAMPSNPSYEQGVLKAGEVCELWFYTGDSHKLKLTPDDFRAFWSVPSDVKVIMVDGNSSRDKNFSVKNSDTGTYVIMKPSQTYPQRRSDDENYNTEDAAKFWSLEKNYNDVPEVVCWAVVDFGQYDPLYKFSSNNSNSSMTNNYTLHYAPADKDNPSFTNGFLTVSFASAKRCHLVEVVSKFADAGVGKLSDSQKALIDKAAK